MATIYLKTAYDGNVKAKGFSNQILITGCAQGSSRSIRSAVNSSKNRGMGTMHAGDVSVTKKIDPASNELWQKAFKDGVLGDCLISHVRTDNGPEAYRTSLLTDCIISNYECECSEGSDRPVETISLNFTTMLHTFTTPGADNTGGTSSSSGYDLPANEPI